MIQRATAQRDPKCLTARGDAHSDPPPIERVAVPPPFDRDSVLAIGTCFLPYLRFHLTFKLVVQSHLGVLTGGGTQYVSQHKINEGTYPSLAVLVKDVGHQEQRDGTLDKVPADAVG